jgi:5-histidylcysteine sulfoxide synthase
VDAPLSFQNWSRLNLLEEFNRGWEQTEILFSGLLSENAFLKPPEHGLRHPLIFYFNHPAVFYINKLHLAGALREPLDAEFERHFAIGVDENSWDDLSKNQKVWPPLAEVRLYRERVRETVTKIILSHPDLAEVPQSPMRSPLHWAILMGIEHERIHFETSAVLIREMAIGEVLRPDKFPAPHPSAQKFTGAPPAEDRDFPSSEFVEFDSGQVRIGKPQSWPIFGWDNEYGAREAQVPAFFASRYLTSNGEFFEFVEGGGYRDQSLWSEDGWKWRAFRSRRQPRFWVLRGGKYFLRTVFDEVSLPWSWPAVVNFHEANAFALWRSRKDSVAYRLINENEHHRLRVACDPRLANGLSYEAWYGSQSAHASTLYTSANFGLRYGSESPVNCDTKEHARLLCDVFGNVWQWCRDVFAPLEGFAPHSLYADYSTPCFDGRHHLLLGGSFISMGEQTSPWVRNNFRPHFFQNAGMRLVASD